jgi:hypothetical protein
MPAEDISQLVMVVFHKKALGSEAKQEIAFDMVSRIIEHSQQRRCLRGL